MIDFVSLRPLGWIAAIVVLAVVAARFSLVDRPRLLHWASVGLRAAAIVLLLLALCRPYLGDDSDEMHAVFLLDVSQSVDMAHLPAAVEQIDQWI